mmetsp:Transcript_2400/g.3754  ORF Transcript_2400/g.3754 Transcript_2400/m.3754 type:complete len:119 (+) Transcript_2400:1026-1382(+)
MNLRLNCRCCGVAEQDFEQLDADTLELWRSKQPEHNLQGPVIKVALADATQKNNTTAVLRMQVKRQKYDYWCSTGTIRRRVTSRDGYRRLLSDDQKQSTSILLLIFAVTAVVKAATTS